MVRQVILRYSFYLLLRAGYCGLGLELREK